MTAGLFAGRWDWFGELENALSKEEEAEYRKDTTCHFIQSKFDDAGMPCDPQFIRCY